MKVAKKLPNVIVNAIERMLDAGDGDHKIATAIGGITRHDVRKVKLARAEKGTHIALPIKSAIGQGLSYYDAARTALAHAKSLVDVKDVADRAVALKEYARRAKDRDLEIDAAELRIRAERRLGEMLLASEKHSGGRPRKEKEKLELPTLAEIGVDHKLSARAQKLAKLSDRTVEARIEAWRKVAERGAERVSLDLLRGAPINGARSVMGSRAEPDDSLDFFPTPPWATRALVEVVLRHLEIYALANVWEPACGEGHISWVLADYATSVIETDVFDYGEGQGCVLDFLKGDQTYSANWIITNPPFSGETDRALAFTMRALELARDGVAMFVRSQWAFEGIERYETLFRDRPPTLVAPFVERVNLCRGKWDPKGGTATAYCWLVWVKGVEPRAPFWIPPGQKTRLTKPDDAEWFAAWSLELAEAVE